MMTSLECLLDKIFEFALGKCSLVHVRSTKITKIQKYLEAEQLGLGAKGMLKR